MSILHSTEFSTQKSVTKITLKKSPKYLTKKKVANIIKIVYVEDFTFNRRVVNRLRAILQKQLEKYYQDTSIYPTALYSGSGNHDYINVYTLHIFKVIL